MRALAATAALLAALALAGCDSSRLAGDGDREQAGSPAADTGPGADPGAGSDPLPVATEGLSDEEIIEIETALIDAEALLASIEAELAQDE